MGSPGTEAESRKKSGFSYQRQSVLASPSHPKSPPLTTRHHPRRLTFTPVCPVPLGLGTFDTEENVCYIN